MHFLVLFLLIAATPAAAQPNPAPLSAALAEIEAHRIDLRIGCPLPMPVAWSAPAWEHRAAAERREAFEDCLAGVMQREQDRLQALERHVAELHAADPDSDWSAAASALDSKWSELDRLESKLRTRDNMADTAQGVLDTFTGPGAPFGPPVPAWSRCAPYRCDSSTSAPGIR
ncbi:MAG: hypothetical protein ACJ8ER_05335 [Allosphingosinicella sp.]